MTRTYGNSSALVFVGVLCFMVGCTSNRDMLRDRLLCFEESVDHGLKIKAAVTNGFSSHLSARRANKAYARQIRGYRSI